MSAVLLDFEVVWHDRDMVEVRVEASNGDFAGTTLAYTSRKDLLRLADSVALFPRRADDGFKFSSSGQHPRVALAFYCIDGAGHGAVRADLRRNLASNSRAEEEDRVLLEIPLGGASVAQFAGDLRRIVRDQGGTASLFPRSEG
jgi:hypothetical protein